MSRPDGRQADHMRPINLIRGWAKNAGGSCLCEFGDTRVLCTATIENSVPPWMRNSDVGWLTAEYGMLPASTHTRHPREGSRGKPDGRTVEIQRLIGRSLRCALDMHALGQRTILIDCDVLQADGGTRTASITGAWVAVCEALHRAKTDSRLREGFKRQGKILLFNVAAVSAGIVGGQELLDLCYEEDSRATLDMNVVMDNSGRLLEVQAGGEGKSFSRDEMNRLLDVAHKGITELIAAQNAAVADLTS